MLTAKPGSFIAWLDKALPWLLALFLALTVLGIHRAFMDSPPDYQQGETVRIMYVHVPSAWLALMIYLMIGAASAAFLIWRNPLYGIAAEAAAPIGAAFTMTTLATGAIWGKPIWGTWWVWDARLTSMLVLFFLYLGYMALIDAFDHSERGLKTASVLAIVGLVNLPVIKFSVEWWNTLHQPSSILRLSGPSIHGSMLAPLFLMFGSFLCFSLILFAVRLKTRLLERKILRLRSSASGVRHC